MVYVLYVFVRITVRAILKTVIRFVAPHWPRICRMISFYFKAAPARPEALSDIFRWQMIGRNGMQAAQFTFYLCEIFPQGERHPSIYLRARQPPPRRGV
ncbi:hypothetical protein ACQKH5_04375 [Hyphomonas sp. NPDC076900]|uniref:hypothetical protein n=1 Tax=unclassified Hyphomonas TaxID=2630699 RepID=UPI003D04B204